MKRLCMLFLAMIIAGCGQASGPETASKISWLRDFGAAKTIAQQEAKPLLLDFYTDWCGWCKKMDKDTYGDDRVAEQAKKFVCVKINADKQPQLTKELKVRGFPSTVFLKTDGTFIKVVPGYAPPEKFLKLMDEMERQAGR